MVRGVIYSDRSGAPDKPLATSATVTVTAGQAPRKVTLSFPTPVLLLSGNYWLGLHTGGPKAVARYAAKYMSAALRYNGGADLFSDGSSNPFGAMSTLNKQMSISAIGTAG